jgi:signal transduction histidine kinase/ActR/RegA family two-component response regulator
LLGSLLHLRWLRFLFGTAALATVYFGAAKLGLRLGIAEQVSAVWPPTGIALAAVLLCGFGALPGVALGAFLANATANEPLLTAGAIAGGNTLEAFVGAWLLRRVGGFDKGLDRLRDVLGLVLLAAIGSTLISATIGAGSLCLTGVQPGRSFAALWSVWWLGDAVGALVITPLLLTLFSRTFRNELQSQALEALILLLSLGTLLGLVFGGPFLGMQLNYPVEYVVFPFVIWAGLRFSPGMTALVTALVASLAIYGTLKGFGPLGRWGPGTSLILLQSFISVVGVTGLVLSAAISERRQAEQEKERLFHEVQEVVQRKDAFLATLAHELRNPLAPIRNSLHIMKSAVADRTVLERARRMIERQVHHLVRLVDDLLDVSRAMTGKLSVQREQIELAAVISRAVETAHPIIEAGVHELSVRLPPYRIVLEGDMVRLAQVIANLLNNAAKYTERGGRIELSAELEGNQAVLRVRDNGMGIAAEMLEKVFQPFVQAERSLARSHGGMGVGLALARTLVEMHGGRISARSAGLGSGSEFEVRLPAQAAGDRSRGASESDDHLAIPSALPRRDVLVVDDNVDAAESLAMLLRLEGQDVRVAHNGVAALAAVRSQLPAAVFLDLAMPGMDGYEVARRLRQEAASMKLLLVAVTGHGTVEDQRRSREAGFDHHLTKPIDPASIHRLLAQTLRPGPRPS